jgi:PAS domain S-box-containing protein
MSADPSVAPGGLPSALIVEDGAGGGLTIQASIRRSGLALQTELVAAREQFEALLSERPPHLVLCPYWSPALTSLEALQLLRTLSLPIPLIVVNGPEDVQAVLSCMRAGAVDYVLGPENLGLVAAVERVLEQALLHTPPSAPPPPGKPEPERVEVVDLSRRMGERLTAGILVLDPEQGVVLDLNPVAVKLIGGARESLLGRHIQELLVPVDLDGDMRPEDGLHGPPCLRMLVRADGSKGLVSLRSSLLDIQGRRLILMSFIDLSRQVTFEGALQLARTAIDQAPEAIFWTSSSGRFLYVNQRACSSLGYTREELLSMCVPDIDPRFPERSWSHYWHRARREGALTLESVHRTRTGHEFPVELSIRHLRIGEQEFCCTFARDISRRKESRRLCRLTVEVLALLNRQEGLKQTVHRLIEHIRGFSQVAAVAVRLRAGEDYPYFATCGLPPELAEEERYLRRGATGDHSAPDAPFLDCLCPAVLQGKTDPGLPCYTPCGSFWTGNAGALAPETIARLPAHFPQCSCLAVGYNTLALIPLTAGDETVGLLQLGDPQPHKISARLVRTLEELAPSVGIALQHYLGTARQQALECRLRQSQKLECLGTLASGVAHEINNPINGIINYAQLIIDAPVQSPQVHEYASEIILEANRVARIVRSLLNCARHDPPEAPSAVSFQQILEPTLTLLGTTLRKEAIALETDLPGDLPAIHCRCVQIQQVLLNLLINARDALNERFPQAHPQKLIRIRARTIRKGEKPHLRITVEDQGGGIPDHVRPRIFDPFFTTKARGIGTGLGLAVCRQLIEAHKGEITVETRPGAWTRMHVDLPTGETD